jgi:hypothetical protein
MAFQFHSNLLVKQFPVSLYSLLKQLAQYNTHWFEKCSMMVNFPYSVHPPEIGYQ